MHRGRLALIVVFATLGLSCDSDSGDTSDKQAEIVGTWTCDIIRPANLSVRPWYVQFRADGTGTYGSGTNTSNLPGSGLTSRSGNGDGDWTLVGAHDYNFRGIELLYKNGNIGGRWLVDLTFHMRTEAERAASPGKQSLCTGTVNDDTCATSNAARVTKFVFDEANGCECMNKAEGCEATSACLNNAITGETPLLNTAGNGNGNITAIARCNRIDDIVPYGATAKAFPLPAPTAP